MSRPSAVGEAQKGQYSQIEPFGRGSVPNFLDSYILTNTLLCLQIAWPVPVCDLDNDWCFGIFCLLFITTDLSSFASSQSLKYLTGLFEVTNAMLKSHMLKMAKDTSWSFGIRNQTLYSPTGIFTPALWDRKCAQDLITCSHHRSTPWQCHQSELGPLL